MYNKQKTYYDYQTMQRNYFNAKNVEKKIHNTCNRFNLGEAGGFKYPPLDPIFFLKPIIIIFVVVVACFLV